jgi:drug/metabolite transporter (DMT)-like permease
VASRRPIIAALGCTLLWGVAGAIVSQIDMNAEAMSGFSALVQAAILYLISRTRPTRASASAPRRALLVMGTFSAFIGGAYFASLQMAPPAIASALHLTAPVILVVVAVVGGRRAASLATITVISLLATGVATSMLGSHLSLGNPQTLIGFGLALGSAAGIACNATLVKRHGHTGKASRNAAIIAGVSATPYLPLLVTHPPTILQALLIVMLTACCWVPACLLNWYALKSIPTTLSTAIGVNEALITGAVAWTLFGRALGPVQIAGAAVIIFAVLLEARLHQTGAATTAARRQRSERRDDGHQRLPQRERRIVRTPAWSYRIPARHRRRRIRRRASSAATAQL